jgi:hypothetical protein
VSITAGDTVTWVNNDTINHTATDDDSAWDTGVIEPGESVSVVFTTPGTANYHCELHPTMTGTVVVASAAQSSGTSSGVGGGSTATGSSQPVSGISGPTLAMLAMGLGLIGFGVVFYKIANVLV